MALGARVGADEAPFVLLISDRPAERAALARGIGPAMACHAVGTDDALPAARPDLAVVDVAADGIAAVEAGLRRVCDGRPVPRLVIARGALPAPAMPGARYLPAASPPAAVLAGILEMIAARRAAVARVSARRRHLDARSETATGLVADLFGAAAAGERLPPETVERGTEIVLDAVSGAGILAWLGVVWRHHAGVYQHTLSVAGYAAAFGAALGLARADQHRLGQAALLHDIGKSRIPPAILDKPGPLDAAELRLMRRHPGLGADLLAAQGGFDPAILDVVRHHHERLDGLGYPDGLAGDAVADLVRLVAICDVFSALTERRVYRVPASPAQALSIMAGMGGQFDPALLRAFAPVAMTGPEPDEA